MGVDYLVPGSSGFAIEKRADLDEGGAGSVIAAVRTLPNGSRTPAYSLDGSLKPFPRNGWQRAVFLQGSPAGGLVADDIELMAMRDVIVEKFRPLGPPPTRAGHLFSGVWVRSGGAPILVFDPKGLLAYMAQFQGSA